MTEIWETAVGSLRFAFQPIALASSGQAYGYEALLRGWREAGFYGIDSVFDCAFIENILPELDQRLRAKVLGRFRRLGPGRDQAVLQRRQSYLPFCGPGAGR